MPLLFSTKQKWWLRRGKFPREGLVIAWCILPTVKVIKTAMQSPTIFQIPWDSLPQLARWLQWVEYAIQSSPWLVIASWLRRDCVLGWVGIFSPFTWEFFPRYTRRQTFVVYKTKQTIRATWLIHLWPKVVSYCRRGKSLSWLRHLW